MWSESDFRRSNGYRGVEFAGVLTKFGFDKIPVEIWLDIMLGNQLDRVDLAISSAQKRIRRRILCAIPAT